MGAIKFLGPVCQIRHFLDIDDGTQARTPSPTPPTTGLTEPNSGTPVVASGSCSYLNPRSSGTVNIPDAVFDRLRGSSDIARVSRPQPINAQALAAALPREDAQLWADGSATAISLEIRIGGEIIRLIRPVDADEVGMNLPTTTQIIEALRVIPASQRSHTSRIIACPRTHPDSRPRTGSAPAVITAAKGGFGTVTFYRLGESQSQNDIDNRLMHEIGHNYQEKLWDSGPAVAEWAAAIDADNQYPSEYCNGRVGEDFCEFNMLYVASRNTPCEEVARQIYPHRWAKMVTYQ